MVVLLFRLEEGCTRYGDDAAQFPISQGSSRGPQIVITRRRSSGHSQEFVLLMRDDSAPYSCKKGPKVVIVQMQRSVNAIREVNGGGGGTKLARE